MQPTGGDLLEQYREWMATSGLATSTIKQRVDFIATRLARWPDIAELAGHDLADWLAQHHGWTRATYHSHLSSFYEFLIEAGHREHNPMARIRRPRQPQPHSSPLSNGERDAVFEHATGDLRTWLSLAYYAGFRVHEIAKIRGRDIDQHRLRVLGKGQVDAALPTHPELWSLARDYPRDDYWFPSPQARCTVVSENHISSHIRAHFRSLGIERGSVHRLRHTYANDLLAAGVNVRVIQKLMRHQSLTTTEAYLDGTLDQQVAAIHTLRVGRATGGDLAAVS